MEAPDWTAEHEPCLLPGFRKTCMLGVFIPFDAMVWLRLVNVVLLTAVSQFKASIFGFLAKQHCFEHDDGDHAPDPHRAMLVASDF